MKDVEGRHCNLSICLASALGLASPVAFPALNSINNLEKALESEELSGQMQPGLYRLAESKQSCLPSVTGRRSLQGATDPHFQKQTTCSQIVPQVGARPKDQGIFSTIERLAQVYFGFDKPVLGTLVPNGNAAPLEREKELLKSVQSAVKAAVEDKKPPASPQRVRKAIPGVTGSNQVFSSQRPPYWDSLPALLVDDLKEDKPQRQNQLTTTRSSVPDNSKMNLIRRLVSFLTSKLKHEDCQTKTGVKRIIAPRICFDSNDALPTPVTLGGKGVVERLQELLGLNNSKEKRPERLRRLSNFMRQWTDEIAKCSKIRDFMKQMVELGRPAEFVALLGCIQERYSASQTLAAHSFRLRRHGSCYDINTATATGRRRVRLNSPVLTVVQCLCNAQEALQPEDVTACLKLLTLSKDEEYYPFFFMVPADEQTAVKIDVYSYAVAALSGIAGARDVLKEIKNRHDRMPKSFSGRVASVGQGNTLNVTIL